MIVDSPAAELFLRYSVEKESIERKLRGFGISQKKRERLNIELEDLKKRLIPGVIDKIKKERR